MSAPLRSNRRRRVATCIAPVALAIVAFASAVFGTSTGVAMARSRATSAPATPEPLPTAMPGAGPARDLEAGRLIAELAEATDDPAAFARANASGFVMRAFDRLDVVAAASGDAHIFDPARVAFASATATPSSAYAALAIQTQRFLTRLTPRAMRVTLLGELVRQIAFNANVARDPRADATQRVTLANLDDADSLDPEIAVERRTLLEVPDDAWRAIAINAAVLETTFDRVIGQRNTPTPPPVPVTNVATPTGPGSLHHSVPL